MPTPGGVKVAALLGRAGQPDAADHVKGGEGFVLVLEHGVLLCRWLSSRRLVNRLAHSSPGLSLLAQVELKPGTYTMWIVPLAFK